VQEGKDDLQTKFVEDRVQIQKEKEQFLTKKIEVKEAITRELRSLMGLEKMKEHTMESQESNLVEAIQQLQQRVVEL
jgi:hypothetical protein